MAIIMQKYIIIMFINQNQKEKTKNKNQIKTCKKLMYMSYKNVQT